MSRRPIRMLTGFLGAGKTTLLTRQVAQGDIRPADIILNDSGEQYSDDFLLEGPAERPQVILGGCVCCTRREALVGTLLDLADRCESSRRAKGPLVIETSGLSDPGPIAATIAGHPVLRHHFELVGVDVAVDAVTAVHSLSHSPVARRQVQGADRAIVTKCDLVRPAEQRRVAQMIRYLNPSAALLASSQDQYALVDLVLGDHPALDLPQLSATPGTREDSAWATPRTLDIARSAEISWESLSIWLSLLVHAYADQLLRIKGTVELTDVGWTSLNVVQGVVHIPVEADPPSDRVSRLVVISQGLDPARITGSFESLVD